MNKQLLVPYNQGNKREPEVSGSLLWRHGKTLLNTWPLHLFVNEKEIKLYSTIMCTRHERNDFSPYSVMKFALIKKIDFTFSNLMHSALVSISGTKEEMFVHIQLINSFLRKIFGVEHIRFSSHKGEIKIQDAKHPFAYEIAQLITSKLSEEFLNTDVNTLKAV